jgi:hypothetical protein
MTLPEQSERAVAQTREFLVRLSSPYVEDGIKGIRREVRAEALRLLRHYPYVRTDEKRRVDDMSGATAPSHGWVPASVRLPEDRKTVLLSDGDWITMGRKVDDEWYVLEFAEAQGFCEFIRLPFWMPLPEPSRR